MSAISQIVEKLRKYPELNFEQNKNSISVHPLNEFNVWLTENENSFTVGFSGWHEEFILLNGDLEQRNDLSSGQMWVIPKGV